MSDSSNDFVWYDLMTSDPQAAIAFYGDVIGLEARPFDGEEEYWLWMVDEVIVGGVAALAEEAKAQGAPPHWMAYVRVADVAQTVAKAEELGATVYVPATDMPGVGVFAVLADPQGAVFAVFDPASGSDEDWEQPRDKPGAVTWHELMTTDIEAGLLFYEELFDWKKTDVWQEEGYVYQMFGQGDETFGGVGVLPDEVEAPPYWMVYFAVDDLDAALERAEAGGGRLVHGPMEVPGGERVAHLLDLHGAVFAIHEPAASEA